MLDITVICSTGLDMMSDCERSSLLTVATYCRAETCLDDARCHAVDPDVAVCQFRCQGPRQTQQGCLTHTVRAQGLIK